MLEQALALHRQGRLPEAEQAYRAILAREPENAHVGLMLGQLALDAGLPQAAVPILERVVMLDPGNPAAHTQLGLAYMLTGRQADAVASFDRALALDAAHVAAHHHRGTALAQSDPDAALASFARALALAPDSAATHNAQGLLLSQLQRHAEALPYFEAAARLNPDNPMAHSNLGFALVRLDRHEDAIPHFERAVALAPDNGEFYYNLGDPLMFLGRGAEALAAYDRAVALKPVFPAAHVNRGLVLTHLGRTQEALDAFDRAIAQEPRRKSAHMGRSGALVAAGREEEALAHNRELAQNPLFRGDAEFHSAVLLLQRGDWAEGWTLYEARRIKENPVTLRRFPQPEWRGEEPLDGKTLFVHAEQGLGDTMQFCRYLALAQQRAARVVFAPQQRLKRLMQGLTPPVELIGEAEAPDAFDCHIPLLSLPLAFGTRPETIPLAIPYLKAEPALVEKWAARIGQEGFRIGVCWSGSPNRDVGVGRSFPLRELAPIAALPGVRLISLQKTDGLEQLAELPPGMTVETPGADFDAGPDAFIDTAAILPSLDLVISCDTSVAHLAGAMGRPCWVALKMHPEWRWVLRDDGTMPWYPSMTLFRQTAFEDWPGVFAAMAAALKAKLA